MVTRRPSLTCRVSAMRVGARTRADMHRLHRSLRPSMLCSAQLAIA